MVAAAAHGCLRTPVDFAEYRAVLAKIDAKFAEIAARHPKQFACQSGCHGCCLPGLTVSAVEADHIRAALADDPSLRDAVAALDGTSAWRGERCALLNKNGQCSIYAVRPALCRAHGAPTWLRDAAGELARDVCPLNFADLPLTALDAADGIDLTTLTTLLYVVGARHAQRCGLPAEQPRVALTPAALLRPADVDAAAADEPGATEG